MNNTPLEQIGPEITENALNEPKIVQQGSIEILIVERFEDLARHADEWNRLAFNSPQQVIQTSYAWCSSYFENLLSPEQKWICFLAYENNELIALLPIVLLERTVRGVKWLGANTPNHDHAFSVDFIARQGQESEIFPILIKAIFKIIPGLKSLIMERLPENSPSLELCSDNIPGIVRIRESSGMGAYMKIKGPFENFQNKLSHNFRRNLSKARKKLAQLPSVRVEFIKPPNLRAADLQNFMGIEVSGWKGKLGTAILMNPSLINFYSALTENLNARCCMEWQLLLTGDKVIASNMAFRMGRKMILWKIAYDESYAHCAPGNMLFEKIVEHTYETGDADEIDCLTDMAWHDNWGLEKRNYYNLKFYPKKPLPLIFGVLPQKVRQWVHQTPIIYKAYLFILNLVGVDRADFRYKPVHSSKKVKI